MYSATPSSIHSSTTTLSSTSCHSHLTVFIQLPLHHPLLPQSLLPSNHGSLLSNPLYPTPSTHSDSSLPTFTPSLYLFSLLTPPSSHPPLTSLPSHLLPPTLLNQSPPPPHSLPSLAQSFLCSLITFTVIHYFALVCIQVKIHTTINLPMQK